MPLDIDQSRAEMVKVRDMESAILTRDRPIGALGHANRNEEFVAIHKENKRHSVYWPGSCQYIGAPELGQK